jgi:AcrR family transcriptional regulator
MSDTHSQAIGRPVTPVTPRAVHTVGRSYADRMTTTRVKRRMTRRQEYSSSTRKALLKSASELFAERGYAGTSLDEVVSAARVTKGALYHHFAGKLALFQAVFDECEAGAVRRITADVRRRKDPWDKALSAVSSFLAVCQEPAYRRIVMQEGPVALGFDRWRESEERSTYGLVHDMVRRVLRQYQIEGSLLDTFTRIFYGAMSSAGIAVSEAEDAESASREVATVISLMLAGLRQMAEAGVDLTVPVEDPRAVDAKTAGA